MRSICQKLAATGGAVVLSAAFAVAADIPTGVISDAQLANLDGTAAALGANVYAGDLLATSDHGSLHLRVGKGQLYMLASSDASVTQDHGRIDLLMKRGTVGLSATIDDPLEIDTPVGTLRPANTAHAFGQVTMDGPRQIVVTSYEGTLALSYAGETRTIEEGKSYRVLLTSSSPAAAPAAQNGQGSGSGGGHHDRLVFDVIVLGGSAVAGFALWEILTESQSTPGR